ncbi:hypothetical protein [Actinokineospora sp. UTMC 2448]|uniref:hypothetical protein n=1 Tax=Actinokineospora sp. UTMC 2448 TaxID=2268449 RepID=UPI0021649366|nr:hypothetical protein [Actinokineospora sp. UTMC 2448]UVS77334.1 hypothetical protein Actkin_01043 [Actinokineospora sp. UTMC 2448]
MTSYTDYLDAITRLTNLEHDLTAGVLAAKRRRDAQLRQIDVQRREGSQRAQRLKPSVVNRYSYAIETLKRIGYADLLPATPAATRRAPCTESELATMLEAQQKSVQDLQQAVDDYQRAVWQVHQAESQRHARLRRMIIARAVATIFLVLGIVITVLYMK